MFGSLSIGATVLRLEDFEAASWVFHSLVLFFVVGFLLFLFTKRWYFARRRIASHKITAEYEPPIGLNPLEMSYLFRRKLSQQDFAAQLVYMAQEGVVHFR